MIMGYNLPYQLLSTLLPHRLVGEEYKLLSTLFLVKGVVSHSCSPGQGQQALFRVQDDFDRRRARTAGYHY
jgi:hypothetical protein